MRYAVLRYAHLARVVTLCSLCALLRSFLDYYNVTPRSFLLRHGDAGLLSCFSLLRRNILVQLCYETLSRSSSQYFNSYSCPSTTLCHYLFVWGHSPCRLSFLFFFLPLAAIPPLHLSIFLQSPIPSRLPPIFPPFHSVLPVAPPKPSSSFSTLRPPPTLPSSPLFRSLDPKFPPQQSPNVYAPSLRPTLFDLCCHADWELFTTNSDSRSGIRTCRTANTISFRAVHLLLRPR